MTYIINYKIPMDEATKEERTTNREVKSLFKDLMSDHVKGMLKDCDANEILRTIRIEIPGNELEGKDVFEYCKTNGMIPRTATFSCWDTL